MSYRPTPDPATNVSSVYIDRHQAARFIGMSYSYLAHRADNPAGPPMIRLGRRVLYKVPELEAWLDAHRVAPPPRPRGRPRKDAFNSSKKSYSRTAALHHTGRSLALTETTE